MSQSTLNPASTPHSNAPNTSSHSSENAAKLDHIVLLLPYTQLLDLPKHITTLFTITPGGRHADNKTENKLILFPDGSYIELIAFINDDPSNRAGHGWGKAKPGIIDYALTTALDADAHWQGIQSRLADLEPALVDKYDYAPPVAGGRRRPDGVEVEWRVTFPTGVERGELPFFCHDVTPRERRVPFSEKACTHPCGAYGLKELTVTVSARKAAELSEVYSALLGQENLDTERGMGCFVIETIRRVEDARLPRILVRGPEEEGETSVLLDHLVLGITSGSDLVFRLGEGEDTL